MKAIEQRVAKLEQAANPEVILYAWAEAGETGKEAIARRWPEGVPENATLIVYSWSKAPLEDPPASE